VALCPNLAIVCETVAEESEEGRGAPHHASAQLPGESAPDVRVNALAFGLVKTKLAAAWEAGEERNLAHIPLRPLGLPDDIATSALFAAPDAASRVTVQTFVVDGGTTAPPSGGVG
jgi:NAD(P)-dependent dehydrogenase (short-subunit alcohol dehydrogenase family)